MDFLPDSILESPGFILERISHSIRLDFSKILKHNGSTATNEEFMLLLILFYKGGRKVTELARDLFRNATTITRQVDGLLQKGYVVREYDETDRRVVIIQLTDVARDELAITIPHIKRHRRHIMDGVSQSDFQNFHKILQLIHSRLGQVVDLKQAN